MKADELRLLWQGDAHLMFSVEGDEINIAEFHNSSQKYGTKCPRELAQM